MFEGDCVELSRGLLDNSIDFGIHSPPFCSLYIYSDSENDMGNCATMGEFMEHYKFLIRQLYRATKVGRLCAVHCKDLPKYANRDDTAGLIDFPGEIIKAFIECGWSYHSRVTIWKCPVTERERTNNNGLLHKTIKRDSSQVRQGMADYLLVFRKAPIDGLMADVPIDRPLGIVDGYRGEVSPLENDSHPSPFARKGSALVRALAKTDEATRKKAMGLVSTFGPNFAAEWATLPAEVQESLSIDIWRRYAEPVWWDIDQTDVLNFQLARTEQDEKHICPLQIGLIRRAVQLWSKPGDVVLSPFAGVGSELVGALREGRKGVGFELKPSYFDFAVRQLRAEDESRRQRSLF